MTEYRWRSHDDAGRSTKLGGPEALGGEGPLAKTRFQLTWPSWPFRIPSLTLARPWFTSKPGQVAVQIQDVQLASPWIIDQISTFFLHGDLQFYFYEGQVCKAESILHGSMPSWSRLACA